MTTGIGSIIQYKHYKQGLVAASRPGAAYNASPRPGRRRKKHNTFVTEYFCFCIMIWFLKLSLHGLLFHAEAEVLEPQLVEAVSSRRDDLWVVD